MSTPPTTKPPIGKPSSPDAGDEGLDARVDALLAEMGTTAKSVSAESGVGDLAATGEIEDDGTSSHGNSDDFLSEQVEEPDYLPAPPVPVDEDPESSMFSSLDDLLGTVSEEVERSIGDAGADESSVTIEQIDETDADSPKDPPVAPQTKAPSSRPRAAPTNDVPGAEPNPAPATAIEQLDATLAKNAEIIVDAAAPEPAEAADAVAESAAESADEHERSTPEVPDVSHAVSNAAAAEAPKKSDRKPQHTEAAGPTQSVATSPHPASTAAAEARPGHGRPTVLLLSTARVPLVVLTRLGGQMTPRLRQTIGYIAITTLFWAAALWCVVFLRSPGPSEGSMNPHARPLLKEGEPEPAPPASSTDKESHGASHGSKADSHAKPAAKKADSHAPAAKGTAKGKAKDTKKSGHAAAGGH